MRVSGTWRVLCVLSLVCASSRGNEAEYEGNYADSYDNQISQDQQGGELCLYDGSFLFVCEVLADGSWRNMCPSEVIFIKLMQPLLCVAD